MSQKIQAQYAPKRINHQSVNDNQAEESRRKRQREWYELLAYRPREKSAS